MMMAKEVCARTRINKNAVPCVAGGERESAQRVPKAGTLSLQTKYVYGTQHTKLFENPFEYIKYLSCSVSSVSSVSSSFFRFHLDAFFRMLYSPEYG